MNKVWDKLRKHNQANYRQFKFCISFSVLLISSYLMMLFSPLVQNTLPVGGDSRKQIYMIFGIAAVGCIIFVLYTTGLFYRYKSRELGVFLALGSDKGKLTKATLVESAKLVMGCMAAGIVGGCVTALIIGKIFEMIASEANDNKFALSFEGLSGSLIYGIVIFLLVLISLTRSLGRSNVLEIMNQQRKQEPIKNMVTVRYLALGIAMLIIGVFLAAILPGIVLRATHHHMGIWTNLFYLLALVGLYRIMVYSIASHRRGRNPQKYYKNVISYGMLKFQGRSIVRNMLVITLLVMGGLFAFYYAPMSYSGDKSDFYEAGYHYFYSEDTDEVTETEVREMAGKYGVEIENYREGEFIQIVGDGMIRENFDAKGNLIEEYAERYAAYQCISVSEYEILTGEKVAVEDGTYIMIVSSGSHENLYNQFGTMEKLYMYNSGENVSMEYTGNVIYESLVFRWAFDEDMRCIISDRDYALLKEGLPQEQILRQVLFDTDNNEASLAFSNELYREFVLRMSDNMKVPGAYNSVRHEVEGDDYGYNYPAVYDADNPARETDWRYAPNFIYLSASNGFLQRAVFFLMFLYVAVICLAAVGIVSYTRSQSVGLGSKQVFDDLKKLGANNRYVSRLLKTQVKKVYVLPTAIGCVGMFAFETLLLHQNDGGLDAYEFRALGISFLLTVAVVFYQYLIYRISMRRVTNILGLSA